MSHFMRVLPEDLPRWEEAGWRPVVGEFVPSLGGHEVLVEWEGEGEPRCPTQQEEA